AQRDFAAIGDQHLAKVARVDGRVSGRSGHGKIPVDLRECRRHGWPATCFDGRLTLVRIEVDPEPVKKAGLAPARTATLAGDSHDDTGTAGRYSGGRTRWRHRGRLVRTDARGPRRNR